MFRAPSLLHRGLPQTYRALQLSEPGAVTNFRMATMATREPSPSEVVVGVQSCAVAYRDVLDRQGAFKFIKRPTVLGHEFAGTVLACGSAVTRWRPGDRVVSLHWDQSAAWPSPLVDRGAVPSMYGLMCDGGYAELCTATQGALACAPAGLKSEEAAAVMSTFGTVWQGAVVRGGLRPGDSVVVTGASGGVGSAAVQLARALGCRVTAVTTSAAKVEALRKLGADECVVANSDGQFKVTKPVSMVIEAVGGPTFASSLRATAPGGKVVLVGNVTNANVQLPLGYIILNSIAVVGSDSIEVSEFEKRLLPFMERHQLRPLIDQVLPLEDAGLAHQKLEERRATGRLVLRVAYECEW